MERHAVSHFFGRGEGYMVSDRKFLHGRTGGSEVSPRRLVRLVFATEPVFPTPLQSVAPANGPITAWRKAANGAPLTAGFQKARPASSDGDVLVRKSTGLGNMS
jgi:hypothetical protein